MILTAGKRPTLRREHARVVLGPGRERLFTADNGIPSSP